MPEDPLHEHDNDADIRRWFRALGPPPQGQAPPYLRASVRAQIAQRRARRGLWAWLPQHWPAVLVPVLAAGLVLSLAMNVWWKIDSYQTARPLEQPVHAYQFLQALQENTALGTLVAARAAVREQPIGLGFALQDARIIFFRMGIMFTNALAALQSETLHIAAQHLDTLAKALHSVQAPQALSQYLREIQALQQSQRYSGAELAKFLALFEPLLAAEYAQTDTAVAVTLFRLGAWLETMALAAATGDPISQQQESAIRYFRSVLPVLQTPPEVEQAFAQMQRLMDAPALTEADWQTLRDLIQRTQKILGALDL